MAETRPRISSGVLSCKIVERSTTDTPSNTPEQSKIANASQKWMVTAKAIIHTPKPATAHNSQRPAFKLIGNFASNIPTNIAPTAGAARKTPKPSAP